MGGEVGEGALVSEAGLRDPGRTSVRTPTVNGDVKRAVIRHVWVTAALHADETQYVEKFRQRPSFVIGRALDLAGYPMNPWHSVVYTWMYNKAEGEL